MAKTDRDLLAALVHVAELIEIGGQRLENALPYAAYIPARVPGVDDAKVAKTLRQISLGYAGAVAVEHCFNKQAIVFGCFPYMSFSTGQKILDSLPLVVPQSVASAHQYWCAVQALLL